MTKPSVSVSASQVAAAKLKIKRDEAAGRESDPAVKAIADAHKSSTRTKPDKPAPR